MSIDLTNIHSLTEFRHNAKTYVEELQAAQVPLVLTVNGEAAVVVESVATYQAHQDYIRSLEAELQKLKLQSLKEAVALGAEQAKQGQFSKRSFDEIIAAAHGAISGPNAS